MARYIDLSDQAKASVQRRDAAKTDWNAEMVRIANEAQLVKTTPIRSETRRRREIERLRREYKAAERMKHFAETGENIQHRTLNH